MHHKALFINTFYIYSVQKLKGAIKIFTLCTCIFENKNPQIDTFAANNSTKNN
jgi:hypothetical protein